MDESCKAGARMTLSGPDMDSLLVAQIRNLIQAANTPSPVFDAMGSASPPAMPVKPTTPFFHDADWDMIMQQQLQHQRKSEHHDCKDLMGSLTSRPDVQDALRNLPPGVTHFTIVLLYQGKTEGNLTEESRKESVDCEVVYSPNNPTQQVAQQLENVHNEEEEMRGDDTS